MPLDVKERLADRGDRLSGGLSPRAMMALAALVMLFLWGAIFVLLILPGLSPGFSQVLYLTMKFFE